MECTVYTFVCFLRSCVCVVDRSCVLGRVCLVMRVRVSVWMSCVECAARVVRVCVVYAVLALCELMITLT